MQQITIRGIAPEIEQEIRKIAKGSLKSINQVIYRKFKKAEAPASSLRPLAGGWNEKDAAEFERSIKSCKQIDIDIQ